MDQNAMIRNRVDQILKQRIALGLTAGGVRRPCLSKRTKRVVKRKPAAAKKCPKGSNVRPKKKPGRKVVKRKQKGGDEMYDADDLLGNGVMAGDDETMAGVMAGGCAMCPMCQGAGVLIGGAAMRACKSTKTARTIKRKPAGAKKCPKGSKVVPKKKPVRKNSGSKTSKRKNPWVTFLKKYANENGMTYQEAMSDAAAKREYKQQ
jgi:hypothetical protein